LTSTNYNAQSRPAARRPAHGRPGRPSQRDAWSGSFGMPHWSATTRRPYGRTWATTITAACASTSAAARTYTAESKAGQKRSWTAA